MSSSQAQSQYPQQKYDSTVQMYSLTKVTWAWEAGVAERERQKIQSTNELSVWAVRGTNGVGAAEERPDKTNCGITAEGGSV